MRKNLLIFLCMLAALSTPMSIEADDKSPVSIIVSRYVEPDPIDDIPNRHRIPSKQIVCTINVDEISIDGMDVDDIVLYEVYDMNSECLLSTSIQEEFTSFVLSSTFDMEIRLHTSQFTLKGFIQR